MLAHPFFDGLTIDRPHPGIVSVRPSTDPFAPPPRSLLPTCAREAWAGLLTPDARRHRVGVCFYFVGLCIRVAPGVVKRYFRVTLCGRRDV